MTNYRVLVTSNCQTAGLAAALKVFLPHASVKDFPVPRFNKENGPKTLARELESVDIWVTSGQIKLAEKPPVKILKVPRIVFSAFHPDLCYADDQSTNEATKFPYNSRIAVWCYNNDVEPTQAKKLFNSFTYRKLGYFNYWNDSVSALKESFINSGFSNTNFEKFYFAIKKRGLFMHSVNHPHIGTIAELGKLLANKIVGTDSASRSDLFIPDGLAHTVWPLYTEIGQQLGLAGDYSWRLHGEELDGVLDYIEWAYESYKEQEIKPMNLVARSESCNLDKILNSEIKRL